MLCRGFSLVRGVSLVAATFLLLAPAAPAGPSTRSGPGWSSSPSTSAGSSSRRTVSAPVVRWGSVSATVAVPQPARPYYVRLRGPDGKIRRFPVEGGPASIQYTQVVVRPGQSVTISYAPAR
jgi:hypothetical protein